jgi:hypothetical protein
MEPLADDRDHAVPGVGSGAFPDQAAIDEGLYGGGVDAASRDPYH